MYINILEHLLTYLAPVLVWIYGGGFVNGGKGNSGNPAGLLARSQQGGSEGFVWVAMNYRLGLFVRCSFLYTDQQV